MISRSTTTPIPLGEYVPRADQRIVLRGVGWAGFRALLALRGERRRPRMAYLDGAVDLMGTSRDHEQIKSWIGCLVEAFCLERGVAFSPSACGGDGVIERACARDDECNFLPAGTSVDDCVDQAGAYFEQLTPPQRRDVERRLEQCLEFETCSAWNACVSG